MTETEKYNAAAQSVIEIWTGTKADENVIDLVADLLREYTEQVRQGDYTYAENLLEKASTFVETDLSDEALESWVAECDDALRDYGVN